MSDDLPTPMPNVTSETETFWAATADGKFLLRKCGDCDDVYHYPRALCPDCLSDTTEWVEAAGKGSVYSYTVIRVASGEYDAATPYVLAHVELEEGPRVMTNIVDVDPADVQVGQTVEVVFEEVDEDTAIPRFRPV